MAATNGTPLCRNFRQVGEFDRSWTRWIALLTRMLPRQTKSSALPPIQNPTRPSFSFRCLPVLVSVRDVIKSWQLFEQRRSFRAQDFHHIEFTCATSRQVAGKKRNGEKHHEH